ncbi:MAG TPA: sulfite exporter TauE/SafE family protein [Gaiellales bacterium]|nr:sulfite exporter TauE/SafE family protein [Gaiellales bacterium]
MTLALLAVAFGLAIGLSLGLVGGGGSILAVPVLVYVLGEPVAQATTASLVIVGATALAGGVAHHHAGRTRLRVAALFGLGGAVGAVAGTALQRLASPGSILLGFALLMLLAAWGMVRGLPLGARSAPDGRPETLRRAVPAGVAVGILTGFFGVGGGFVIVPALVLVLGMEMPLAVGTSLLVISLTSGAALLAHLHGGAVDWPTAIAFTAGGVAGALAGSRLVRGTSSARLTQTFAAVTTLVAIFLIVKNVHAIA